MPLKWVRTPSSLIQRRQPPLTLIPGHRRSLALSPLGGAVRLPGGWSHASPPPPPPPRPGSSTCCEPPPAGELRSFSELQLRHPHNRGGGTHLRMYTLKPDMGVPPVIRGKRAARVNSFCCYTKIYFFFSFLFSFTRPFLLPCSGSECPNHFN